MILAIIGAAAAVATASPTDSRETAMNDYMTCLADHAHKIDDHTSDASTIATAIELACPSEEARLKDAYSDPADRDARRIFDPQFAAGRHAMAIRAVLFSRRVSN